MSSSLRYQRATETMLIKQEFAAPEEAGAIVESMVDNVRERVFHILSSLRHTQKFPEGLQEGFKGLKREIELLIRAADKSSLARFLRTEAFKEMTDNIELPENKLLEPHDFDSEFVRDYDTRYKRIKKMQDKQYSYELAKLFLSRDILDGLDEIRLFLSEEKDEEKRKGRIDEMNTIFEGAKKNMKRCFSCVHEFLDELFFIIQDVSGERIEGLHSSFYSELRSINDFRDLLAYMHDKREKAHNTIRELRALSESGDTNNQEYKNLAKNARDFTIAFYEAQRVYGLLIAVQQNELSFERQYAEEFDDVLKVELLQKLFSEERHKEPAAIIEAQKKLLEEYNIPVHEDGSATIFFYVNKDESTGKTHVEWDWSDEHRFSGKLERVDVEPRILIDRETGQRSLCLVKTGVKTAVSHLSKEIRSQGRITRDYNRMMICFVSANDKIKRDDKNGIYNPLEGKDPVDLFYRKVYPIEVMDENLLGYGSNKFSDNDFQCVQGVARVNFYGGSRRLEIQMFPDIRNYLINASTTHSAGHSFYVKRRTMKGLVPQLWPKDIYGEQLLERILYPVLQEYAEEEMEKFYERHKDIFS